MKYKVVKPYTSYSFYRPLTLPVGTVLEWWEERGFYLSQSINNVRVRVAKWAVEAWHDYFEPMPEEG